MHISLGVRWLFGKDKPQEINAGLFKLLHMLQNDASLKKASVSAGMSYRHAWGLLKKWETEFNSPLVIMERGRGKGARLTGFGEKLLWAEQLLHERCDPTLEEISRELNDTLSEYMQPGGRSSVRIFASHGMAIMLLNDLLRNDDRFTVDFQIHGSLESLQNLHSGHCQVAGFHLPLQLVDRALAPQYQHWLVAGRHSLLQVAIRDQGILVKKHNPKNITTLGDLTKRSVRFINRQRNSGTRTIFDQLLKQEGISPRNINGYSNEEFTHVAVAAMIASGAADAGFGIQAAAGQFKLDFIPYLKEAYVLAMENNLNPVIKNEIRKKLKSDKFRNKINKLAGYNAETSGRELSFRQLFGKIHPELNISDKT